MNQQINWDEVVKIARENRCQTRLKVIDWEQSEWSAAVLSPVPNYIELPAMGPVNTDQLQYLDIRVRFENTRSKYGRPQIVDVTQAVAELLNEKRIPFGRIENGEVFRIQAK